MIAFFAYFFLGARSLSLLIKKKWKFPRFTGKQIILSFLVIFLTGFFFFLILSELLICAVLFDIFLLAFVSGVVFFVQLPTVAAKRYIINKAKKKRQAIRDLIVIGITGSCGKTSTKEILYHFLSQKYKVLKTEANNNTEIGVAGAVLKKLNKNHQVFVVEMGAYRKGEIKAICDIVKPKIGILTAINNQHLALFGSQENIIKAKFELIESLPKNGLAVLNWQNRLVKKGFKKKSGLRVVKIGKDIWAENINAKKESLSFKMVLGNGKSVNIKTKLAGRQNVENILLASAGALELGLGLREISKACLGIKDVGIKISKRDNFVVLDSSYSANQNGVMADLEYLNLYSGEKIIIMPSLIELGPISAEVHRKIGKKIGEICDLAIITTKDYFSEILKGAVGSGMEKENISYISDPGEIFKTINAIKKQKIILLEGRVPAKLKDYLLKKEYNN